jgi:hypothetical protein
VIWTLDGVNTPAAGTFTTLTVSGAATFSSTMTATNFISTVPPERSLTQHLDHQEYKPQRRSGRRRRLGNAGSSTRNRNARPEYVLLYQSRHIRHRLTSAARHFSHRESNDFTDADSVTIGGRIVPTTQTVTFYEFTTMVDAHMWIAPRAGKVVSIKEIHSVVGGAACAIRPEKDHRHFRSWCCSWSNGQGNHHRGIRLHRRRKHYADRNAFSNRF